MNEHDATEMAYKLGYQQGVKEFAERVKARCDAPHWCVWLSEIDQIAKEMGVEL